MRGRALGTTMFYGKLRSPLAIRKVFLMCGVTVGVILPVGVASAPQVTVSRQQLSAAIAQLQQTAGYPGLNPSLLSASGRNLLSLSKRWPEVTKNLSESAAPLQDSSPTRRLRADLLHSRYSGFTRSETSTAWCGRNVVIAFNDTGAEMTTMASGRGISQVGYAVSQNRGKSFTYMGPLPALGDPNTFASGDAVAACSSGKDFYVISTWLDGRDDVSGVILWTSADGGRTFSQPTLVVGKSSLTHIMDHPWIAIDPNARNLMYIAYADLDFSGSVCGSVGSTPVPGYAIEVLSSSDDGATWAAPPVPIDQVCADATHAFSFVDGAQLAVGPQGQVYVVREAYGVNGSPSDRNLSPESPSGASRAIGFAKSLDQGAGFSAPVWIIPVHCAGDCSDWQGLFHSNEYPSLAIGKGLHKQGNIYVAWNDGDRQVSDSLSPSGFYDYTDILLIHSSDGGTAWSKPERVNNNPEGSGAPLTDQFEPALATDIRGRVSVCFYDRRRDRWNFRIDRYCAVRRDSRWVNNRTSAKSFPVIVGQDILLSSDYMGDYDTLAADFNNHWPGFVGAYATNRPGRPTVLTNTYRANIP